MFIFIDPAPSPFKCPPPTLGGEEGGGETLSAKFTEQKMWYLLKLILGEKNCVLEQAELTLEG